MSAEHIAVQLVNGLAYAMLLFLVAAGLSLIFGLQDVVNLAHGSLYMLGGYVALSVVRGSGSFWLALVIVPIALAVVGYALEAGLLRRLYGRGHLDQVLLTLGVAYVIADLARAGWGTAIQSVSPPPGLAGSIALADSAYPAYRLFVIAVGLAIGLGLWLVDARTRWGAIVRAGVADREMVQALGIDVRRVFALTFAGGAALAGVAGVIASPILGVFPGVDAEILILALIVVVIGGLGTLKGAFWGSLVVGELETLGRILLPQYSIFLIFALMAGILVLRPAGLFGRARA